MNFEDKLQKAFEEGYRQAINEQKKPVVAKAYTPRKYFNAYDAYVEKELVSLYKKLMARLKSDYEKKALDQTFPFELADEIKKKVENLFDGPSMRDELIDIHQYDSKLQGRLKDYDKRARHGFRKKRY